MIDYPGFKMPVSGKVVHHTSMGSSNFSDQESNAGVPSHAKNGDALIIIVDLPSYRSNNMMLRFIVRDIVKSALNRGNISLFCVTSKSSHVSHLSGIAPTIVITKCDTAHELHDPQFLDQSEEKLLTSLWDLREVAECRKLIKRVL